METPGRFFFVGFSLSILRIETKNSLTNIKLILKNVTINELFGTKHIIVKLNKFYMVLLNNIPS